MGQILHGSATTTHAVRAAIQRSKASIQALSERHGINPKTVAKWRRRASPEDCRMGPKVPHSTVLSAEEEVLIVAFRRHTLLPLDDCLYALQATVPHLTRSSLHRLFQRQSVSRLPNAEGTRVRRKFNNYPIGYIHIDLAEVWTDEGKLYLFVAIDRVSKFAFAELHERATPPDRGGLPAPADRACPVHDPHGPDRQWVSIHAASWRLDGRRDSTEPGCSSAVSRPCLRLRLRAAADRASP